MAAGDIFDGRLRRDPTVALAAFPIPDEVYKQAPLHRLRYVVEMVGQRTLPADQVKALLEPAWQAPLGNPELHVMSQGDAAWRCPGLQDLARSYDSVALAWPFLTARGNLAAPAAQRLLDSSEHFAKQVGRRAMAIPLPADVEEKVKNLCQIRDGLDVGVTILFSAIASRIPEKDIWLACAALGLDYVSPGYFQFRVPGWDEAILEIAPLEDAEPFSIAAITAGKVHEGFSIGFSVPRSPDPISACRAVIAAAAYCESAMACKAFDDLQQPLTTARQTGLLREVGEVIGALCKAGFRPGSPDALELFVTI